MKKSLMLAALVCGPMCSYANDATPLPLYKDYETKEEVVGCVGSIDGMSVVALRQSRSWSYDEVLPQIGARIGKVATYTAMYGGNQRGVELSTYNKEGSAYLPGNGEYWSYRSPNGTVLAAKGNYKAVFVYRDLMTQEYKGLYYNAISKKKVDLECSADANIIQEAIKKINEYAPMQ